MSSVYLSYVRDAEEEALMVEHEKLDLVRYPLRKEEHKEDSPNRTRESNVIYFLFIYLNPMSPPPLVGLTSKITKSYSY